MRNVYRGAAWYLDSIRSQSNQQKALQVLAAPFLLPKLNQLDSLPPVTCKIVPVTKLESLLPR